MCIRDRSVREMIFLLFDLSLVSESTEMPRRTATVKIAEETYLLSLPSRRIMEIHEPQVPIDHEMQEKLDFIIKHPIFKDIHINFVKSLARSIRVKVYRIGEVVIRQGAVPPGLFIIKRGFAKLTLEQEHVRPVLPMKSAKRCMTPTKRPLMLARGRIAIRREDMPKHFSMIDPKPDQEYKAFIQDLIPECVKYKPVDRGTIKYKDEVIIRYIGKGGIFAGYTFLKIIPQKDSPPFDERLTFTVAASSPILEVVQVDPGYFAVLDEDTQKRLVKMIQENDISNPVGGLESNLDYFQEYHRFKMDFIHSELDSTLRKRHAFARGTYFLQCTLIISAPKTSMHKIPAKFISIMKL
eukprot:TRINITY_DN4242_c0_g2_i6.p1 TRINITY_DN4242_c0_g2~~TRINITY_DN4242_c0_g2_i6.p1  ORF type:complete len:373 (-),score=11.44 TRINITY_DN4242_c0_g2_i6:1221-2279(-)